MGVIRPSSSAGVFESAMNQLVLALFPTEVDTEDSAASSAVYKCILCSLIMWLSVCEALKRFLSFIFLGAGRKALFLAISM